MIILERSRKRTKKKFQLETFKIVWKPQKELLHFYHQTTKFSSGRPFLLLLLILLYSFFFREELQYSKQLVQSSKQNRRPNFVPIQCLTCPFARSILYSRKRKKEEKMATSTQLMRNETVLSRPWSRSSHMCSIQFFPFTLLFSFSSYF